MHSAAIKACTHCVNNEQNAQIPYLARKGVNRIPVILAYSF